MTKAKTSTKTKAKRKGKAETAATGRTPPRSRPKSRPKSAPKTTKAKLAPPKANPRAIKPPAARPRAEGGELTQEQLDQLQDSLYQLYAKLGVLKPSAEENEAWTEQYTAVTDAIRALRNHQLDRINSQLKGDAANVAAAVNDAHQALRGVQDNARILTVVGNVFKAIASIAALV